MDEIHVKLKELSDRINNLINPDVRYNLLFFKLKYAFNDDVIKLDASITDRYNNTYITFWSKGRFVHPSLIDYNTIKMAIQVLEESIDLWIAYGKTNDRWLSLKDAQNAAKVIYYNKYEN